MSNLEQQIPALDESDDDEYSLKSYIDAAVDEITNVLNEHIEIQNKNIKGLDEDLKAMREEFLAMIKAVKAKE
jgi:hypothetical protein